MVGFYLFFVYLSTHLSTQTGRSLSQAMWITTTGLMALVIFTPVMAGLSDRWGRRHLCLAGCAVLAFAGPVLFRLFETRDFFADLAGIIAFAGAFSLINATGSILLAETIPTRIRASVFSIAFNLSAAIFGGFAPFAATALIGLTANPVSPGFLLTGAAIISGISFWLSESSHSTVGWKSVLAEAKA
jgi:MFS transporter, MHS family, proline/betaine transporter